MLASSLFLCESVSVRVFVRVYVPANSHDQDCSGASVLIPGLTFNPGASPYCLNMINKQLLLVESAQPIGDFAKLILL